MSPEESLVCSIFEQAIEDYAELKKKNITERHENSCGYYSIKDIEAFFGSQWSTKILQLIGCDLSGIDILHKIQEKYGWGGKV